MSFRFVLIWTLNRARNTNRIGANEDPKWPKGPYKTFGMVQLWQGSEYKEEKEDTKSLEWPKCIIIDPMGPEFSSLLAKGFAHNFCFEAEKIGWTINLIYVDQSWTAKNCNIAFAKCIK